MIVLYRRKLTLLEAWNKLKRVHRRAQPNDGFAKILLELDKKLHGKVSMEWQQRKPMMKVCPICGKQYLAQAPFAESTKEAIVGERGQCHDDGNPKGFERTQDESRRKCQPYTGNLIP